MIPGLSTFIACLALPLEIGILLGVGLNVIFILYHAARPKINVERLTVSFRILFQVYIIFITNIHPQSPAGTEYLIITPDRCLIFPSVDYVRNLVTKHSIRQSLPVVIDCSHVYGADYTAAMVIGSITQDFAKRDQPLFFYNLKPSVCTVFEGLSPVDFVVYYREEDLDELMKEKAYKPKQVLSA